MLFLNQRGEFDQLNANQRARIPNLMIKTIKMEACGSLGLDWSGYKSVS